MGGWQPAVRSPTSSQGSEGASDSLRAMLKLVCSPCCPILLDVDSVEGQPCTCAARSLGCSDDRMAAYVLTPAGMALCRLCMLGVLWVFLSVQRLSLYADRCVSWH